MKINVITDNKPAEGWSVRIDAGALEDEISDVGEYDIWLEQKVRDNDPEVCEALNEIAEAVLQNTSEVNLLCSCEQQLCHGHIIRRYVENALAGLEPSAHAQFINKRQWK
jgi:hypothetical protein